MVGPHHRRARRAQARAGVRHRVDGRPQARRVRAHPHVPVPRRPGEGRGASLMTGPKTNERPGERAAPRPRQYVRVSASKAREVLDLIRGLDVARGRRGAAVHRARCRHPDPQGARLGRRQRRAQRRAGPRRALRLGLLRRRGPDAEALPPRARGRATPDPQAHLPHHGHREPHARRALERQRAREEAQPPDRAASPRCGSGRRPLVASASPAAAGGPQPRRGADETTSTIDDEHDHERRPVDEVEAGEESRSTEVDRRRGGAWPRCRGH